MRHCRTKLSRTHLSRAALLAVLASAGTTPLHAADVTWNDVSSLGVWGSTMPTWSNGVWNNAAGNAAIFGSTGAGFITALEPVSANSLDFRANGYNIGGAALNLVAGSGTLPKGNISTSPGVSARIDSAINTGVGLTKRGAGTLELAGPLTFSGTNQHTIINGPDRLLPWDLYVAGYSRVELGGKVKILNESVLPSTTRVLIGNGILDLGSNNVTLGALTFMNQADTGTWDAVNKVGTTGVIGTGTLRVTGDITVRGASAGNDGSNTIANKLDIGSGTQVIRISNNNSIGGYRSLILAGTISGSGALLKTSGYQENGILGSPDGIGLLANNTYTGATILNGGQNLVTGTNASKLLKVTGGYTVGGATSVTLMGADGSFQAADKLQAFAGGNLIIDNNASLPAGSDYPTIASGNNGNRLKDTAELQLRGGGFSYISANNQASSETFGTLSAIGGHNIVSMTATGASGTSTLTASGGLELAPRATLQVTTGNAGSVLGGNAKLFINGAMPAADGTGILRGVVGKADFVRYDAATGLTPLAAGAYASSFAAGAGANVAVAAASTIAGSVNVNAVKTTGTFTTTIAAGQTLGVDSGMMLNASGTATYTGGTLAFGAAPGTFFGGVATVNSAITGTNGLIVSNTQLTVAGDLSGLSGPITSNTSLILATNTFAGAIEVRAGGLAINTSQTLPGQGAITLGVKENDADLLATNVSVSLSGAGANAVIARDFIVDNGSTSAAGQALWYSHLPQINPLSNTTGSQTLSGNFLLNTSVRMSGGGATATSTGATNITGNIAGAGEFRVTNGRVNFSGNLSNAGGFRIGEGGNTAKVTFSGTKAGSAPITLMGSAGTNTTTLSYAPGSLPTGLLTVRGGYGNTAPVLIPLASSAINNDIVSSGADIKIQADAGVVATFNGAITSGMEAYLIKQGAGTLVLTNAGNSVGSTQVNGGTLLVNGALGGLGVAVNTGGTLGGSGSIQGEMLVNAGGTVTASMVGTAGTLSADKLTLNGTLLADVDLMGKGAADLLSLGGGGFSISGGSLQVALGALPTDGFSRSFMLVSNGGSSAINGTFSSIGGLGELPANYSWSIDYAFKGVDSLGRVGDGNDLALRVTAVPEPSSYAMFLGGGALLIWMRRRRQA